MKDLSSDLIYAVSQNRRAGEKTLVFIYYAGHGVIKNRTYAVLNDDSKKVYPIESLIRNLSLEPACFSVGLIDACREQIRPEDFQQMVRGGLGSAVMDDNDPDEKGNFILTFGCAPCQFSPQKSHLVPFYFEHLAEKANPATGAVVLPSAITLFKGRAGEAETVSQLNQELEL